MTRAAKLRSASVPVLRTNPDFHPLGSWLAASDERAPLTSNSGSLELPFQRWIKFKEAYSPRLVSDLIGSLGFAPTHCVDPFGGSGTTALTCAFLGIQATTIEVNPFLADLIRAKLDPPRAIELARDHASVMSASPSIEVDPDKLLGQAPKSLVEPGIDGNFVFSREVARAILQLRCAIDALENCRTQRLFRVLLAGSLLDVSNVVVNGKGRRYRRNWQHRRIGRAEVFDRFCGAVSIAAYDIARHPTASGLCKVVEGDSRTCLDSIDPFDLAIFSPPYPNSFDYTDVYNLELWMLGYLDSRVANLELRRATLRSHVQLKLERMRAAQPSGTLEAAIKKLRRDRKRLWNPWIPDMVAGYFEDLVLVMSKLRRRIAPHGRAVAVVGNSRYASTTIDVAKVLEELAPKAGFRLVSATALRSMRSSAQRGGAFELNESVLTFQPS